MRNNAPPPPRSSSKIVLTYYASSAAEHSCAPVTLLGKDLDSLKITVWKGSLCPSSIFSRSPCLRFGASAPALQELNDDVRKFLVEWESSGPMVQGISPLEAVERLRRFKEEMQLRERKVLAAGECRWSVLGIGGSKQDNLLPCQYRVCDATHEYRPVQPDI